MTAINVNSSIYVAGRFTFWIRLSLRPKTETKRLNFGLSPESSVHNKEATYFLAQRHQTAAKRCNVRRQTYLFNKFFPP